MSFNAITPTRWGQLLYHRNDFFIGRSLELYGDFSIGEANMLAALASPGAVAMDGGANQGVFTVHLARLVGPAGVVYAFEPQRLTYQLLCGNLALNSLANVHAIQAALGAEAGTAVIPVPDLENPVHTGGAHVLPEGAGEQVPVVTIDGLNLPRLDLLKLDIEGHERLAIRGARRTIERCRPVIYVENDKPEHFLGLISDIRAFGYRMFWHCPPMYSADNWRGVGENIFAGILSTNMLCLPPGDEREFGLEPVTDRMPGHIRDMFCLA